MDYNHEYMMTSNEVAEYLDEAGALGDDDWGFGND